MIPMAVKAIVDWARAVPGCLGVAVFTGDYEMYSEAIDLGQAEILLGLLLSSPGARRASAAFGGFTLAAFRAGEHIVVLKVAGRFPALLEICLEEPIFVDPSCAPALPSQAEARSEAEAALRQFGLL
jgi:hypothetical protein